MSVVAYSQRDERWANQMLGEGELPIGQVGCLLSAVASLLATWGQDTDPGRLNDFIKRSYGFVDGNLFVFASVDGLACRFVEFVDCETIPAPVAKLQAAVASGRGVICCVDATPGGPVNKHWVWLYAVGEIDQRAGWQIVDPWRRPGYERIDLGSYLASGWDIARGIFAAAIYEPLQRGAAMAWRSDVEAHQPAVCMRAV